MEVYLQVITRACETFLRISNDGIINRFSVMFNGGRIVNADEVANMLRLGECSEGTQIPINKDILLPY